ncbi:MAG: type II toxin-antitoxin system VapC family toxin [Gemmatimonadetes bacterium]|nr:type II toxin-antitoxin system VapC family toxin [Gemmatimonadota bacterium]
MVLLDTLTLVFWTLDPDRLSEPAVQAVSDASQIAVSAVSIWEIGTKVQKEQLVMPISVREYTDRLEQIDRFEILPVCARTLIRSVELDWARYDTAGRVIAATAVLNACPIVTSDPALRAFYPQTIW